ncbi:MAG TPA: non-homologous end-joining DNA ligase [Solirubrobacterales bacterium]|jgi:bifunctional non-homologous end joining protein LigD|nr:non-homologous end-joining DNA ligase [Solirubrobacterales bacterium]
MASSQQVEVDGRELKLTNLDKVLYPEAGFTKGEMVDYYAKAAAAMVPHLSGRAVTLRRFPEGVDDLDSAFFEKRCPKHRPKWVKTTAVVAGPDAGKIDFCVCDGRPTLIWMAQLAAIELHPSLSLGRAPKRPTVLAFDLDPGAPADIVDCCRVALRLRDMFGHFGVQSFPKTSGSKGMQVYVPLNSKKVSYDSTKPFAKAIAQLLEKQTPDLVISKMKKVEREGKIFVDWSQNHQSKTTIAVYSLRARERPTASTPLQWDEVEAAADSGDGSKLVFEAGDVLERIEQHGDLFAPVLELEQELPEL